MKNIPLVFLALCGTLTGARGQDTLSTRYLDEVLVTTGQYEPQSARHSVYSVRVVPMETIESRGAVQLEDVLNTELNVRFSRDGATGSSSLSMQGLSGQNIKILIDGVPIGGRQGVSNEIDINQINVHTIERVEMVEGPMSTLYGADALGGVINIVTKNTVSGQWGVSAGVLEKTAGTEYDLRRGIHNQNIEGHYARGRWHARASVARNAFGGWKGDMSGREEEWHPKDQLIAGLKAGYNATAGKVYYRADYLYEDIYNPGPMGTVQALDEDYITHRWIHQLQGSYVFSDRLHFSGMASYTDYKRTKRSVVVDALSGEKTLSLGQGAQSVVQLRGLSARGLMTYTFNKRIAAQAGYDINIENGEGERVKSDNEGLADYALFASVEWEPFKGIHLRPGLRFTYNPTYAAPPVIPTFNIKVDLSKRHTLRLAYGRGFRAPSLRELYFTFFDSNHSIEGNTDLKAETSHSFNGSLNWLVVDDERARWSIEPGGFLNIVDNKIEFGQRGGSNNLITYVNVGDYQTHGVTLRNRVRAKRFDATVGFSYTYRFFWSPEAVATLSYTLPAARMSFSLYYKYTGETPLFTVDLDGGAVERARILPYHRADLTLRKELWRRVAVTAGVHNLFDVKNVANTGTSSGGVHGGSATSTPLGYGRSYFVGISYAFTRSLTRNDAN